MNRLGFLWLKGFLSFLIATIIIGCGSGDGDNQEDTTNLIKMNGRVIDGEVSGATVFFDKNRNGILDNNEASTKSDEKGYFSLEIDDKDAKDFSIPIVAFGGKDIRLNRDFEETLMAFRNKDSKNVYITPISTLIASDVLEKLNVKITRATVSAEELFSLLEQTQKDFAELFDLEIELLTKDPIEIALKENNLKLLQTNMKINKVVREIKKAVKKELKAKTKASIQSYKALTKALKKAKKEGIKQNDGFLTQAVDYISEVEPTLFDENLIPDVKMITKFTLDEFDKSWNENKNDILGALKEEKEFTQLIEDEKEVEKEIKDKTPAKKADDEKPKEVAKDKTPAKKADDEKPKEVAKDKTPAKEADDEKPKEVAKDKTTAKEADEEKPKEVA